MEKTHGVTPVGHRAAGICSRCCVELLGRFLVPEGVEQRDSLLEVNLCFRRARRGERNASDVGGSAALLVMRVIDLGGRVLQRNRQQRDTGGEREAVY